MQTGFDLVVELPIATIVGNASNAEITRIAEGSNSTVAYSLSSRQRLKANGQNSVYINATIVAVTQVQPTLTPAIRRTVAPA